MFGKSKDKTSTPPPSIRDTLFGDMPMLQWPMGKSKSAELEPWKSFVMAREAIEAGRASEAVSHWTNVARSPGLESRHYLQAWHFLREHGVQPDAREAKALLGIVMEYTLKGGLTLLAAYPERTARFYDSGGGGVVWERPTDALDAPIEAFLSAGQHILNAIGPWDKPRPAPPAEGHVRLNFLSPAGLHFGQGEIAVLSNDPLAKPAINAGTNLMQQLVNQSPAR